MRSLYVLDAVNLIFRSYYAISEMTSSRGESTHALYGFARCLLKLIRESSPSHIVAVFDGPQSLERRKKIYDQYKANRKKVAEDLTSQIERSRQFCDIFGIPLLWISGAEADDVIGSVVSWSANRELDTFICTSDKDLAQLVGEKVKLVQPHKENAILDRSGVLVNYGVLPSQMVDFLALVGDSSDNIPGVAGVGPKTAAIWLNKYGSLDEIFNHILELPEKKRALLLEGRSFAITSRALATLCCDLEVPVEEQFYELRQPDNAALKKFYQEMGFISLLRELQPSQNREKHIESHNNEARSYAIVNSFREAKELMQQLSQKPLLAFFLDRKDSYEIEPTPIKGAAISDGSLKNWYISFEGEIVPEEGLALFENFVSDSKKLWIGYDIKAELHLFKSVNLEVCAQLFDTMIAAYLLSPGHRYSLQDLILQRFGSSSPIILESSVAVESKIESSEVTGKNGSQINLDGVAHRGCQTANYLFMLHAVLVAELERQALTSVFDDIETPLIPVLFNMEYRGILLKEEPLKKLFSKIAEDILVLKQKIFDMVGCSFNLNSPKQLAEVLADRLQIKLTKKKGVDRSTQASVLDELKKKFPVAQYILDYRALEKLRSTYVEALPHQINPKSGKIHCIFNQAGTATGRISCQQPNLQNIPIRTDIGKEVRAAFFPSGEGLLFISADYSQIELRILAHMSEDPHLIQAFLNGEDIHSFTASLIMGVPLEEVTSQMRARAKTVNFGIVYGQQPFTLARSLDISVAEAKHFIDSYFSKYKRVREYFEFLKEEARRSGFSLTISGRKRFIPEINSKNSAIMEGAERIAINTPLQGSAADIIKKAMNNLYRAEEVKDAKMVLQIHDELLFEAPQESAHYLAKQIKAIMECPELRLKVPLITNISLGRNWREC